MAKQQSSQDYVLGLEYNAFSSLEHGIEHYLGGSNSDLKFTVLHVFHAVELLLKARLAKAHPLLILQRPEDDPTTGLTADYKAILNRLKNLRVQLTAEDKQNLDSLRVTRNKIEHYEMQGNRPQIEDYVARAMKLLDGFVEKELDIRLRDRIRPELYREMERALFSYNERQKRTRQRIAQALPTKPKEQTLYRKLVCDECDEEAILMPDPDSNDDTVRCYSCGTKFFYWICDSCGEPTLSTERDSGRDMDICDACWSNTLRDD
jgi:formylmethanofuran dehydrogenase subunit E